MHFRRVKGTADLLKMTLVMIMFTDSDLLYLSIPNGRHLLGEQLDSLTIKELQQLEQQLDSSLKHIRSRKVNKLGLNLLFSAQLIWLFTNVLVNYYIIALFFWYRISSCSIQFPSFRKRSVTLQIPLYLAFCMCYMSHQ